MYQREESGKSNGRKANTAMSGATVSTGRFFGQAEALRTRLNKINDAGVPATAEDLLTETVEQLHVALEELKVTNELLIEQNEQLLAMREELDAERKKYKDLFDYAPEAFVITDFNGTIQEANRTSANLLNADPKFLAGKPLIVYIAEDQRSEFRSRLSRLYQIPTRIELKFRLQPRDGDPLPASLSVGTVYKEQQPVALRWLLKTERS